MGSPSLLLCSSVNHIPITDYAEKEAFHLQAKFHFNINRIKQNPTLGAKEKLQHHPAQQLAMFKIQIQYNQGNIFMDNEKSSARGQQ